LREFQFLKELMKWHVHDTRHDRTFAVDEDKNIEGTLDLEITWHKTRVGLWRNACSAIGWYAVLVMML
jgi:hypothetical protein